MKTTTKTRTQTSSGRVPDKRSIYSKAIQQSEIENLLKERELIKQVQ